MRTQEPSLAFSPWLQEIAAQIVGALASDLGAEVALLQIQTELVAVANAIRSDEYAALMPVTAPVFVESRPRPPDAPTLVRPYAMVEEPARPPEKIAAESLMLATDRGRQSPDTVGTEWRWIIGYCKQARSLAEIAAYGGVPLQVARVMVGKMAAAELLDIQPLTRLDDGFGIFIIKRILVGLRAL